MSILREGDQILQCDVNASTRDVHPPRFAGEGDRA